MNENEIIKRLFLIRDELLNVKEETFKNIAYVQRQIIDLEYDIRESQERMVDNLYKIHNREGQEKMMNNLAKENKPSLTKILEGEIK
jgi:hypothetical protein